MKLDAALDGPETPEQRARVRTRSFYAFVAFVVPRHVCLDCGRAGEPRAQVPTSLRFPAAPGTGSADARGRTRGRAATVLLLLVRSAAASDPELAALVSKSDEDRLRRMRRYARVLAGRGFLRSGVTASQAADVKWALTSPELYESLVARRGWSARRFGEFVPDAMIAALL